MYAGGRTRLGSLVLQGCVSQAYISETYTTSNVPPDASSASTIFYADTTPLNSSCFFFSNQRAPRAY